MELCVVVPTFNEVQNIQPMVERLSLALERIEWEVVFVDDDSSDGTADVIRALALDNIRVRCLQRIGRRGLSAAVIEGMCSTGATYLAVIDGDLQHDESLLPKMLSTLKSEGVDIVIGSRYIVGGSTGAWEDSRARISALANRLSRLIIKTELSDPMSGFFMLRRDAFFSAVRRLSGLGFKILLDLFSSSPNSLRYKELPYTFRPRTHGASKLDSQVAIEYLLLLIDKRVGHVVPARFIMFAGIGALGLGVHLAALWLGLRLVGMGFVTAQTVATLIAMTSNFYLNNILTYRDRRLRGTKLLVGLLSFYLVCSVGVLANIGAADYVYEIDQVWWVAGMAGAFVGAVWNYAMSSQFTWSR